MLQTTLLILLSILSISSSAEVNQVVEFDVECEALDLPQVNKAEMFGRINLEDPNNIYAVVTLAYQLRGNDAQPVDAGVFVARKGQIVSSENAILFKFAQPYIDEDSRMEDSIQRVEVLLPKKGKKLPASFHSHIFLQLNEDGPAHKFKTRCKIVAVQNLEI